MILGIVGFAGSGKGTAGDVLVSKFGFQKVAFADNLKDAVASIFGWPRHLLEGDTDESRAFREKADTFWSAKFRREITPRWALQFFGTEACRDVLGNNIWIDSLERKIDGMENVVITDVRFPNEIDFIKRKGGFVVRVIRGPDPEWYDTAYDHNISEKFEMYKRYPDIHLSEWAWIGQHFHYHLYNDGSKEQLEANIEYMLTVFRGCGNVNK